eukprot:scaffold36239_cov78-Attheya_sp.AAC.1
MKEHSSSCNVGGAVAMGGGAMTGSKKPDVHELKHLWGNKHIKKGIEVWLYLALPVNTLLWGCKSWAITSAKATRLLESFHTKSIRKILGMTMWNAVEALRISNEQILEEFNNMTSMENIIATRQLLWIVKLACLLDSRPKERRATTTHPPQ